MRSIQAGYFAIKVLEALDEPKTFTELLKATGLKANELAKALDELGKKGLIYKDEYFFVRSIPEEKDRN